MACWDAFPELKDAEKYLALGRKLLEQEAAAQIFPDGSYSMYSLNYHRFILAYLFIRNPAGRIEQLSIRRDPSKDSVSASIDYLYQLIDPETGTNARLRLQRWRIGSAIQQL